MEKKPLRKLTKHHIFMIIYGVIALSAVAVFWIFKDKPISVIYDMAVLWLALPIGSMIISYSMSAERGVKGLLWLLPLAFGASMCAVEFLTFSLDEIVQGEGKMPSITLLLIGAFASLIGFTLAKQDRVEKERAERARRKKEAKAAAKAGKKLVGEAPSAEVAEEETQQTVAHEDDYNPGADFIPDENDTWADEVLEREGYGKEQVEYAQSDADFSIDMPEEADTEEAPEESEGEVQNTPEEAESTPEEAPEEEAESEPATECDEPLENAEADEAPEEIENENQDAPLEEIHPEEAGYATSENVADEEDALSGEQESE